MEHKDEPSEVAQNSVPLEFRLENALQEVDPIEAIRMLAIDLHRGAMKKEKILEAFFEFDELLKRADRDLDSDHLEDVIDMMTGCYVGRNLDFD